MSAPFCLPRPQRRKPAAAILPLINVVFLLLMFIVLAGVIRTPDPFALTPPSAAEGERADAADPDTTLFVAASGEARFRTLAGEDAIMAEVRTQGGCKAQGGCKTQGRCKTQGGCKAQGRCKTQGRCKAQGGCKAQGKGQTQGRFRAGQRRTQGRRICRRQARLCPPGAVSHPAAQAPSRRHLGKRRGKAGGSHFRIGRPALGTSGAQFGQQQARPCRRGHGAPRRALPGPARRWQLLVYGVAALHAMMARQAHRCPATAGYRPSPAARPAHRQAASSPGRAAPHSSAGTENRGHSADGPPDRTGWSAHGPRQTP
jgi:hypothetical protein